LILADTLRQMPGKGSRLMLLCLLLFGSSDLGKPATMSSTDEISVSSSSVLLYVKQKAV